MRISRVAVRLAAVLGAALLVPPSPSFAQRRPPAPDEDAAVGAAVGAAILGGVVGGLLGERGHRGGPTVVRGLGPDKGGEPFGRPGAAGKEGRPGKRHLQGR